MSREEGRFLPRRFFFASYPFRHMQGGANKWCPGATTQVDNECLVLGVGGGLGALGWVTGSAFFFAVQVLHTSGLVLIAVLPTGGRADFKKVVTRIELNQPWFHAPNSERAFEIGRWFREKPALSSFLILFRRLLFEIVRIQLDLCLSHFFFFLSPF